MRSKDLEKEILRETVEIGEINGKKIIFNPNISCKKAFSFCEQASNDILNPDGMYLPGLKNILIFCFIVQNMTNLPVKRDKDGNLDIDFIYSLMCSKIGENLINKIIEHPVYNLLNDEIEEILNFKKEVYLRKLTPQNKIFENIDNLISEMRNAVQKISLFADEHKNLIENGTINRIIETLDKVKNK